MSDDEHLPQGALLELKLLEAAVRAAHAEAPRHSKYSAPRHSKYSQAHAEAPRLELKL